MKQEERQEPICMVRVSRTTSIGQLPMLLTADEVADVLRTTRKAVYAMVERGQLPGVTRLGRRRVLFRSGELLDFIDHNTPSPKENRR
jgi:excisionase family DNA binding protein